MTDYLKVKDTNTLSETWGQLQLLIQTSMHILLTVERSRNAQKQR